ncbi:MAG: hypothetical protein ACOCUY_01615 [Verrucomicrobiota bacterium]
MLGNNEPIKGVNLSEAFNEMLTELPWKNLKAIVQTNSQLHKRCTAGGHRIDTKQRKRIEKVVQQEAEKNDFDPAFTNPFFAAWYPLQGDVHQQLEEYFHSDEYEAFRQENEIEEHRYVLTQEKFEEFFSVQHLPRWRLLLCFSPLEFTEEQAKTILEGKGENQQLLDRIQQLEDELAESQKQAAARENESAQARKEADKTAAAAQALRQEKKDLSAEVRQLRNQFETSQAENKKLRSELADKEQTLASSTATVAQQRDRDVARIKKELADLQQELDLWKSRYEEQRVEAKRLAEEVNQMQATLRERDAAIEVLQHAIDQQNGFADLILHRIDWPNMARQMKLTPALRRQFNNLIRKLDYEADNTLTIEGQLVDFWNRMVVREQQLVQTISASDNAEVAEGSVENFWGELTDDFEDVKISLEARAILLKLLQDIFYQTLQMEDLEKPRIPTGKK